jgi:hypothetical protein
MESSAKGQQNCVHDVIRFTAQKLLTMPAGRSAVPGFQSLYSPAEDLANVSGNTFEASGV